MSLARRRMDINSLTNPPDDDWRRTLPESGLRASLSCSDTPPKVVWDSPHDARDDDCDAVVPDDGDGDGDGDCDDCDDDDDGDNESSRSASVSHSVSQTRSPSSSPSHSPHALPLPGRWAWPRIPNPHPSLLSAAQAVADPGTGPVRPRREASRPHAAAPVAQRTRTAAPVPVEGLTKKSRGRRVPTANSAVADGDIVFQAGKDGEKMTRMFACTVSLFLPLITLLIAFGRLTDAESVFIVGNISSAISEASTPMNDVSPCVPRFSCSPPLAHSCPEPDCMKTFSRHDNLIQHMKTHGRTLPVLLPAASNSRESLPSHPSYRYYPGPPSNIPSGVNSRSSPAPVVSEAQPESEVEPESEDDAAHALVHSARPNYEPMDHEENAIKSEADAMDVDSDVHAHSLGSGTHTPALGRPKSQPSLGLAASGSLMSALSPTTRPRQSHERGLGSPQGELHCPHAPCGKTFRRGEHLRRHIKGIHLAERPHACPHPGCGKTFSRHDNLMQHAKRHSRLPDARKSAGRKRTQSAQSATTEGDEPEFESEDEC
ncbi:Transcription factor IIIA [Ceratobasidium theobromae]|uniref:Transcription factor IIIA n=1 Tax=Ceratobasidium theobromae TaxID=1582974 RepID=A0A5N5QRW5_9AGAM|nr:Transcription factor IIIA [Ceratobasidium theobromae]